MIVPILLGAGALILIAMAKAKPADGGFQMGMPQAGQVWQFQYKLSRTVTPIEDGVIKAAFKTLYLASGNEVVDCTISGTNVIVVVRYKVQPAYPVIIGQKVSLTPDLEVTLLSATRAPIA